jgi:hypothetical protein
VVVTAVLFGNDPGPFRVRYQHRPVSGSGKEGKWKGFPGHSDWTTIDAAVDRTLSQLLPLRGLKPGPYELELLVTAQSGVDLRQRTRIEVTEPSN